MTGSAGPGRLDRATLLSEHVLAEYRGPDFVERHWLAERLAGHLADPDCRFVLVSGGPGTGKSALFAWLLEFQPLAPRYFLRRLDNHPLASGDARSVLISVGHQLAVLRPEIMRADVDVRIAQHVGTVAPGAKVVGARIGELAVSPFHHTAIQVEQQADAVDGMVIGLDVDRMVADARLADLGNLQGLALLEPARRLADGDPDAIIVVFVDALDELRYRWHTSGGREDVLDWLAQCPELPPNVRIVLSSRPDPVLLQRFRIAQRSRLREETIEPSAAEVRHDLLTYVDRLLAEPGFSLPGSGFAGRGFAAELVSRAQGSFLYLSLWGNELRRLVRIGDQDRVRALTDLRVLPDGLDGIYGYFLVVLRDAVRHREGWGWSRVWETVYRPILGVLSVAQASLDVDSLLRLANPRGSARAARQALAELAQLLHEDGTGIRLCHFSLAEYLLSTDPARAGDDWTVDAAENHYDIATRLVDRHAGRWQECTDDYALQHAASHLVEAIRAADRSDDRPATTLTGLLADRDFGAAKSHRVGLGAMLGDYVAAHLVLPAREHAHLADGLAAVYAQLIGDAVPDLADTLHAVIGYRTDTREFNKQVLGRLTDPDYLARTVPPGVDWDAALVAFSHGEATRLRRVGDADSLDQARDLLLRAATAAEEAGDRISLRKRGALYYDLAYLSFLRGELDPADEWFARSVEVSEQADNPVGAHISRLVWLRVRLLRGTVTASEYRSAHESALAYFTSDDATGPHVARWVRNVHAQLLDLALLTDDTELARHQLELIEDHPWADQVGRPDLVVKLQARVAAMTGESARAITLFADYLADHLTDPLSPVEELSRDLYYYGRALADSGDLSAARHIWELGLRTPDHAANWPWKPRIAEAVAALPTV